MKYDQKEKGPKKEVEDRLHEICIEGIGEEYRILWQNDDGGKHIVIAFEEKMPENTRSLIDSPFLGWRLVFLICPRGYLEAFHPLKKKDVG